MLQLAASLPDCQIDRLLSHKHMKMSAKTSRNASSQASFKLAALAEFRQDWGGAVTHYQAAYSHLQEVGSDSAPLAAHRHAEVCAVAEQIHLKISMLLLHQQRFEEAVAHMRQHLGRYHQPPGASRLGRLGRRVGEFRTIVSVKTANCHSTIQFITT